MYIGDLFLFHESECFQFKKLSSLAETAHIKQSSGNRTPISLLIFVFPGSNDEN
jgi:hypothetical protein